MLETKSVSHLVQDHATHGPTVETERGRHGHPFSREGKTSQRMSGALDESRTGEHQEGPLGTPSRHPLEQRRPRTVEQPLRERDELENDGHEGVHGGIEVVRPGYLVEQHAQRPEPELGLRLDGAHDEDVSPGRVIPGRGLAGSPDVGRR
jgi:hypothetical protein